MEKPNNILELVKLGKAPVDAIKEDPLLKSYFRNTFSPLEGQKVLEAIMFLGHMYHHATTDEERAVENFCKTILFMCGGWQIKLAPAIE